MLVRAFLHVAGCQHLVSSHGGERARKLLVVSFIWTLIPCTRPSPVWPNYLSQVSPPNTTTLGVRIPTCEFWMDTNIQSMRKPKIQKIPEIFPRSHRTKQSGSGASHHIVPSFTSLCLCSRVSSPESSFLTSWTEISFLITLCPLTLLSPQHIIWLDIIVGGHQFVYSRPSSLDCKLHPSRKPPCCIPTIYNSAWHIVDIK